MTVERPTRGQPVHCGPERCFAIGCTNRVVHYRQCRRHLLTGFIEFVGSLLVGIVLSAGLGYLFVIAATAALETLVAGAIVRGILGVVSVTLFGVVVALTAGFTLFFWPSETRFWGFTRGAR